MGQKHRACFTSLCLFHQSLASEPPYRQVNADGAGQVTLEVNGSASPALAPSCSVVNATMTYVSTQPLSAGGLIALRLPDYWTAPQTYCGGCNGYVVWASTSAANLSTVQLSYLESRQASFGSFAGFEAVGASQWVGIQVNAGVLKAGEKVRLLYRDGFTPESLQKGLRVKVQSRGAWGGELKALSTLPVFDYVAGGAERIDFESYQKHY